MKFWFLRFQHSNELGMSMCLFTSEFWYAPQSSNSLWGIEQNEALKNMDFIIIWSLDTCECFRHVTKIRVNVKSINSIVAYLVLFQKRYLVSFVLKTRTERGKCTAWNDHPRTKFIQHDNNFPLLTACLLLLLLYARRTNTHS